MLDKANFHNEPVLFTAACAIRLSKRCEAGVLEKQPAFERIHYCAKAVSLLHGVILLFLWYTFERNHATGFGKLFNSRGPWKSR
jgi:hypothetical protein